MIPLRRARPSRPTRASLRCDGTACPGGGGAGRARRDSWPGFSTVGAHCIAAVERERPRARAALRRQRRQFAAERRRAASRRRRRASGAGRRATSAAGRPGRRNRRSAARRRARATSIACASASRHGGIIDKRVGDEHAVEGGAAEQRPRIEIARVALGERHAAVEPGATDRGARGRQHLARHVEAVDRGVGKRRATAMRLRPVPQPISSTVSPGGGAKARDRAVAAEQIVLARRVVDVALAPVHAVHQQGGVAHALARS